MPESEGPRVRYRRDGVRYVRPAMPTATDLRDLLDGLHRAPTFEAAASVFVDSLAASGRFLVYRRAHDGVSMFAVPTGEGALPLPPWSQVATRSDTVFLDLRANELWRGGRRVGELGGGDLDPRSRDRASRRGAVGLGAIPLVVPGLSARGMLVEEVSSGSPRDWFAASARRGLACDVAAPALLLLPKGRQGGSRLAGLPVVGDAMQAVVSDLLAFSSRDETVLLRGPTGVGKSSLARACHTASGRTGAFVSVQLASIPPPLQAGQLFGWRKGAFTGADRAHDGFVAQARAGTLFLDEVDKLPAESQALLLRLLDEGVYRPMGAGRDELADVRFIVGTNADLVAAVRAGRFLEDLLYRIDVLPVSVPPLAERRDEIADWVRHFLRDSTQEVEPAAMSLFEQAEWPGNLRQLAAVVSRASAFAGERPIGPADARRALPAGARPALVPLLEEAARAFVTHAEPARLVLDDADAFRGFVLEEAARRHGEREALTRLGYARSVQTGNTQKLVRRELERANVLRGKAGPPE